MDATSASDHCPVNRLADEDLANIFKHLPPHVRLLVSEVSKRWYAISRIPWRDIVHLDLSAIPGENIGAIVKRCPNLQSVFAWDKDFPLNQLHILSQTTLSSLKLYNCSSSIRAPDDEDINLFSAVFSDRFLTASWKELVLCDFKISAGVSEVWDKYVIGTLPASLQRVELKGIDLTEDDSGWGYVDAYFSLFGAGRLYQLTCFVLCSAPNSDFDQLQALKNLRELCIDGKLGLPDIGEWALELPRLHVLFLNNVLYELCEAADLEALTTQHPTLRILCITGPFNEEHTMPVRRRFPNGFDSDPLPLLHVFVGKEPSEMITFTKSPSDLLVIHPITEPLPEFLEKEEIAPLFENVWIASQIKEGAKNGSNWWKYDGDTAVSFLTADDS